MKLENILNKEFTVIVGDQVVRVIMNNKVKKLFNRAAARKLNLQKGSGREEKLKNLFNLSKGEHKLSVDQVVEVLVWHKI